MRVLFDRSRLRKYQFPDHVTFAGKGVRSKDVHFRRKLNYNLRSLQISYTLSRKGIIVAIVVELSKKERIHFPAFVDIVHYTQSFTTH